MARCRTCGADLDRQLQPLENPHWRTPGALDEQHLAPGAQRVQINIGADRRVRLNRLAATTGLPMQQMVIRAVDAWLAEQERSHERATGTR